MKIHVLRKEIWQLWNVDTGFFLSTAAECVVHSDASNYYNFPGVYMSNPESQRS